MPWCYDFQICSVNTIETVYVWKNFWSNCLTTYSPVHASASWIANFWTSCVKHISVAKDEDFVIPDVASAMLGKSAV